ncbi:hypothetical protein NDU88_004916 [Pleurodeles waltl]|uniref:SMB domain-containing protein n=1 Tax=Pleurodeles waltl TaxID=8319 RepID=A0AAV7V2I4_PLEWA|nr:hypothetical protein NDU88_004916 [Pleurodeles waltl]
MSGHSRALLGVLLAVCIGITAGQTTEEILVPDFWNIDIPENASTSSENTAPTEPVADDGWITDIPENASSPSESTEYPGFSPPPPPTFYPPYYPPYQTTGRCGQEPHLCCPGRNDACSRVNCFCDEACYKQFHDCCSDYFPACQGGNDAPPGFGIPTGYPFPIEDPMIGIFDLPTGSETTVGVDPVFGTVGIGEDGMHNSHTAQPGTPLTFDTLPTSGTPLTSGALLTSDTPPTSGTPLTSGAPLTSDYTHWTLNYSQPADCIPTEPGRKFAMMCSGQRSNLVRNCDLYGCGCYRCPRGRKYLKGVDVVCRDGSTVYAPFTGTISNHAMCYGDVEDGPGSEGFTFIGSGFCFKIFNVKADVHDGPVMKGCRLGTMLPMQARYPRITSHIHIQKCDLSDPTGLL